MKKFKFRLETVLKLKEKALNDKMLELAKITSVLNEEKEKLNKITTTIIKTNQNLIKIYEQNSTLDLLQIQSHKDYLFKLDNETKKQNNLLIQIKRAIEEKQKEVQEALKEKNIIEKLKEKQSKRHYDEIAQKESVELDDITISRYKAG